MNNEIKLNYKNKDKFYSFIKNDFLPKEELKNYLNWNFNLNINYFNINWTKEQIDNISFQKILEKENKKILINWENLFILNKLKENINKKVKLIYIDPPYNTGNNSFEYFDNFNHSTWLNFMKDRLEISKELLREDWVICIHIDSNEYHYLKVLMDEIFWRENKINDIIVKVKNFAWVWGGWEEKRLRELTEYILIYAKNIKNFNWFKSIFLKEEIKKEEYENYFVLENIWEIEKEKNVWDKIVRIRKNVNIVKIKDLLNKNFSITDILKKYKWYIFKETFKNQSTIRNIALNNSNPEDELVEIEYTPKTWKDKWNKIKVYYKWKIKRFIWMIDFKLEENNWKIFYPQKIWNLWTDISWNWIWNEWGIKFNNGKKPEKLLYRIINNLTDENDLILDFFSGSWTTCAVAHKINRQYIWIEQDKNIMNNILLKRFLNILNNDKTWISKEVNFNNKDWFYYLWFDLF